VAQSSEDIAGLSDAINSIMSLLYEYKLASNYTPFTDK
jgi:hypothetical protein